MNPIKHLLPFLPKPFQNIKDEGIGFNQCNEVNITLILRLNEDITGKKYYRTKSLMNIDVNILSKILVDSSKSNPAIYKGKYIMSTYSRLTLQL